MMIRSHSAASRAVSALPQAIGGQDFSHHQKYSEAGGNPLNRFPPALFTEQINRSNQSDGYVIQRSWLITCICGTTLTAPHPQRRTQTRRVVDAHARSVTLAASHPNPARRRCSRAQHHIRNAQLVVPRPQLAVRCVPRATSHPQHALARQRHTSV